MSKVMILRLLNGEDIIGTVTQFENGIQISKPMSFYVNYRNNEPNGVLQLSHWLPVQMIKNNETVIKHGDILAVMEPDDHFAEYYSNAISRVQNVLDNQSDQEGLDEETINSIFDSMNDLKNQVIH